MSMAAASWCADTTLCYLVAAGYWSSWYAEARDSQDLKNFLGLGAEDKCLGMFLLGKCDDLSACRSSRRPLSEKVEWRI